MQAARQSDQTARGEVKQLAAALAATHEEHQVCMLLWLRLMESNQYTSCRLDALDEGAGGQEATNMCLTNL